MRTHTQIAFGNRLGRIPATQKYGKAAGSHDDTILSTEYARRIPNSDSINSVSNLMKETLDERFQHLLKNSISLKHFLDFCGTQNTQKKLMYWIDVEIYKSCDESTLAIYAECKRL